MNDLATLGIAVDSSPAAKAASELDKMTSAAERAEDAVVGLGDKSSTALKEVGRGASSLPAALKEVEASATGAGKAASGMVSPQLINQMNQFEASLRSGAKSTGELEMQRSQLRNLQKANMIDDAEAIKINKQLDKTQQDLAKSAVQQEKAVDQLMRSIDPTTAKIAKLERETEQLGKLFDKGGIDAEEYARALGQLDAQFAKLDAANDPIAKFSINAKGAREDAMQLGNALAAGDWQGAARNFQQISASAGGSGAALKALGGLVAGLINPFTLAAASAAALGYVYYDVERQISAFNKALFSGPASSGQTASSLESIAKSASGLGGSISSANDAVIALASSSKLSQAQFVDLAQAASAISEYTGKGAGEVASDLANVGDSATKAAEKISAQYGLLTSAQYEVIAGLDQQGRKQEALDVLSSSLNENAQHRLERYRESLSDIERDWNDIGTAISNAYSKIKSELFPGVDDQIQNTKKLLEDRKTGILGWLNLEGLGPNSQSTKFLEERLRLLEKTKAASEAQAKAQGDSDRADQARIEARGKWDAEHAAGLSGLAKLEDDINKKKALGLAAGKSQIEIDKEVADIRAKYDKSQPKDKAGAIDLSSFNDAENQLKAIVAEYDRSQKELDSLQKAGLVSQEDYSRQSATLIRAEKDEVAAAYQAEITALEAAKAKKGTSAAQGIQLDQKIADARANMVKSQADADSKLAVLATNEEGRLAKQTAAVENYIQALNDQLAQTKQQLQIQSAGVGMGDEARKRLQDDIKIQQDYQDKLDKLLAQRNKNAISQEQYDQQTDAVRNALAERLQLQKDYYAAVEAEQSNWVNGATSAFQTYLEEARNVAGQTKSAFLNAFDSLEDVFVKFITTGKASFKDFANSVIADLARIVVKQQVIAPLLNAVFGGGGGNGATSFGSAVGSLIGGGNASNSNGWGGMVSLGKNLYSAWSNLTGVGSSIASGYASGGISGAISGGAGYYGNMLSNIASTLGSGFTSLIGGNIAITGATAAGTAATTAALTGVTAAQAAAAAATVGAEGVTAAMLSGAVAEGAASIGTNIGIAGATTAAASNGIGAAISSAMSSAAAMWPLAIIMGMYQSGKLYSAGVRPDASAMWESGGSTAFGKGAMLPATVVSKAFELFDKVNSKFMGGKLAAMYSGSTLFQAVWSKVGSKLFGSGYQTKDVGIELGVDGGVFDAQQYIKQKKKGGLISGKSKTRYLHNPLDAETEDALGAAFNDKILNSMGLFSALGVKLSDSVLDGLNIATTRISTQGKTPEAIQEKLDAWFGSLGDSAVAAINAATNSGLQDYNFEALTKFVNNLYSVNDSLEMLGRKLYDVSVSTGFMAEQLVAMAGGAEAFNAANSKFFDSFYTDVEKTNYTLATVTKQFKAMDVALPGSRTAFRSVVDALDLTTESGRKMYVTLTGLAESASQAYTILEQQLTNAVTSAQGAVQRAISAQQKKATEAYNATNTSLSDMVSTVTENVNGLNSVSTSLSTALKALRGDSDDAVKMLRAQAQATLQSALATARSGKSLSGFTGLEDALDTVSNNNTDLYGSMEDFARDQGRTANVVAELNAINGKQLTSAEASLAGLKTQIDLAKAAYDAQMAQYDQALEFAQAQMDALNGVDTSIMGVTAAINAMNAAVVAALQGQATGAGKANTSGNNATLVETLYQSVLGRGSEAAGASYWGAKLQSGEVTYEQAAATIAKEALALDASKYAGTVSQAQIAASKAAAKAYLDSHKTPAFATGGLISGPGTGTSDSILARLSNGEYVMNAESVRMFGTGLLDQMNAGMIPAFAAGGGIGETGPQLEVTGPSRIYNANQTASMLNGGSGQGSINAETLGELKAILQEMRTLSSHAKKTSDNTDQLATVGTQVIGTVQVKEMA